MTVSSDAPRPQVLATEVTGRPPVAGSLRRDTLRNVLRQRSAVVGLIILAILILVAVFAPLIAPYEPTTSMLSLGEAGRAGQPPCIHLLGCPADQPQHLMGLDANIRDEFSRVVFGAQISLRVGFLTVGFAILIGSFIGAIAGFFGGASDNILMRAMDVVLSFPSLILAIAIVTVLGPGLINAQLAIGIVAIPIYARVARASVLSVRETEFVTASRALGESSYGILTRRVMPNALTPLIVQGTLGIGGAILEVAALSFVGLGVEPPTAEWGAMIALDRSLFFSAPHLIFFPGLAITLCVLGFNLLGDGLRDALDPRLKSMTDERRDAATGDATPDLTTANATTTLVDGTGEKIVIEELVPASKRRPKRERGERPLLEVKGLRTSFFTRDGAVRAVDGIDFHVDRGEIMGLVGESGCGKSVTSLSIMRLVSRPGRIEAGEVLFDGMDLLKLKDDEMRRIRGDRISMIFQQPTSSLNPVWDVGRQIEEVLRIHRGMKGKVARSRAAELLKMVGIPDPERRLKNFPHEMSGGMAQRVMIAMALACEPELLIADEPTTALDVTIQAQILDLVRNLRDETGTAIILITHDLGVVAEMCDRVAVMYAGEIVEETDVTTLFRRPKHPYTRGLIGSIPVVGSVQDELSVIPGQVPNLVDLPKGCRFAPRCASRIEEDVAIATEVHPALLPVEPGHAVRCWLYHDAAGGLLPRPEAGPAGAPVVLPPGAAASGRPDLPGMRS